MKYLTTTDGAIWMCAHCYCSSYDQIMYCCRCKEGKVNPFKDNMAPCIHFEFKVYDICQEINEQVARKLGWENSDYPAKNWFKRTRITDHGMFDYLDTVPDYCNDIKAAWELVDDWNWSGDFYLRRETILKKMNWEASFWFNKECKASEWADSAPMAICKAFLKLDEKQIKK